MEEERGGRGRRRKGRREGGKGEEGKLRGGGYGRSWYQRSSRFLDRFAAAAAAAAAEEEDRGRTLIWRCQCHSVCVNLKVVCNE